MPLTRGAAIQRQNARRRRPSQLHIPGACTQYGQDPQTKSGLSHKAGEIHETYCVGCPGGLRRPAFDRNVAGPSRACCAFLVAAAEPESEFKDTESPDGARGRRLFPPQERVSIRSAPGSVSPNGFCRLSFPDDNHAFGERVCPSQRSERVTILSLRLSGLTDREMMDVRSILNVFFAWHNTTRLNPERVAASLIAGQCSVD